MYFVSLDRVSLFLNMPCYSFVVIFLCLRKAASSSWLYTLALYWGRSLTVIPARDFGGVSKLLWGSVISLFVYVILLVPPPLPLIWPFLFLEVVVFCTFWYLSEVLQVLWVCNSSADLAFVVSGPQTSRVVLWVKSDWNQSLEQPPEVRTIRWWFYSLLREKLVGRGWCFSSQ